MCWVSSLVPIKTSCSPLFRTCALPVGMSIRRCGKPLVCLSHPSFPGRFTPQAAFSCNTVRLSAARYQLLHFSSQAITDQLSPLTLHTPFKLTLCQRYAIFQTAVTCCFVIVVTHYTVLKKMKARVSTIYPESWTILRLLTYVTRALVSYWVLSSNQSNIAVIRCFRPARYRQLCFTYIAHAISVQWS